MSQYCCPRCDRTVWHTCIPRVYRRRLPRDYELPELRSVELPDVEYPSLEQEWHATFHNAGGGYTPPTIEEARAETGEHGRRKTRERDF